MKIKTLLFFLCLSANFVTAQNTFSDNASKEATEQAVTETTPAPEATTQEEPNGFWSTIAEKIKPFFSNSDTLISFANAAYALIILVIGWLSPYIGWLRRIEQLDRRIVVIGIVVAAAFVVVELGTGAFTWSSVANLLITFVITTAGLYDKIFSPFNMKTAKPVLEG